MQGPGRSIGKNGVLPKIQREWYLDDSGCSTLSRQGSERQKRQKGRKTVEKHFSDLQNHGKPKISKLNFNTKTVGLDRPTYTYVLNS